MPDGKNSGTAEPRPDALDAMVAAPNHRPVLPEKEPVRVLGTRIAAEERTPLHTHRWPDALYVLSWSDIVRSEAGGGVLVDSRTWREKPGCGATLWSGPRGSHGAESVGGQELRVIAVELKDAGAGSTRGDAG